MDPSPLNNIAEPVKAAATQSSKKFPLALLVFLCCLAAFILGAGSMYLLMKSQSTVDTKVSDNTSLTATLTATPSPLITATPSINKISTVTPTITVTPIMHTVTKTGRTVLSFDVDDQEFCDGLVLTAEVTAGATMTSLKAPESALTCVHVKIQGADYSFYAYVGDSGASVMNMQGAVEIGKLSNGKTLYRYERNGPDWGSDEGGIPYYSYHTIWRKDETDPENSGQIFTAQLEQYDDLYLECTGNVTTCDQIAKSIEINTNMK